MNKDHQEKFVSFTYFLAERLVKLALPVNLCVYCVIHILSVSKNVRFAPGNPNSCIMYRRGMSRIFLPDIWPFIRLFHRISGK